MSLALALSTALALSAAAAPARQPGDETVRAPPGPGSAGPAMHAAGARPPATAAAAPAVLPNQPTRTPPSGASATDAVAQTQTAPPAASERAKAPPSAAPVTQTPASDAAAAQPQAASPPGAPSTGDAEPPTEAPGAATDAAPWPTLATTTQFASGATAPPGPQPSGAAAPLDGSKPSSTPAPPHLGPFRLGPAGHFVELGFAVQLRFNLHSATGTPVTGDVELRRLRLLLRGHLLDDRLAFVVQLNATPAALELIDAWAGWRFTDALCVRVGQLKTPFTRYRQQSFATLALADWSVFATHFGAERQLGVMLHDGGGDRAHWVYQAGVFTGVNARASFARGLAALYAESVTNRSDLRTFHPPTEVHPAFIGRFGHESAGIRSVTSSDEAGGGLRHAVYLSAAWDVRPSYPVDFPLRLAPELLLKWNHVFLDVVAATGFFVDGAGAWGLASVGENVEVGWRFSPRWAVAGRYSRVDALPAARSDAAARAAAIIAAAPSDDAAAVAARYEKAGTPRWTQEVGAALNLYLVGEGLTWQTDVTWVRTDGPPHDEVRLRTQLQLAF
ncbi:MAG: porin [Myxococcota bacterium]